MLLLLLAAGAGAVDPAPKGDSPTPGPQAGAPEPALSEEQSSALLSIPGGPYTKGEDGRLIDGRTGEPVTPEQAEAALALLRARASPGAVETLLPSLQSQPGLYFPHLDEQEARAAAQRLAGQLSTPDGRLSEGGRRALSLALSGTGQPRIPDELAEGADAALAGAAAASLSQDAAALPRSQLPSTLARRSPAPPPPGASEKVAALTKDVDQLYARFDQRLAEKGAPTLGQGWIGNLLYKYTCQTMHDGFRDVIQRQDWAARYPGVQFVGLYQPGVYPRISEGYRNHIFIGVVQDGRVTHYFDPWRRQGLTPYTGRGDLALDREWLEVRPWDGSGSYRVDDQGRRAR